ncbi:MAG: carbamoyltransferase C-terminal domain-containing protein [Bacteroidota bacterium]|nr:carbamoyltransferase C-terminal domain-containing protein [Bacteroidota bacterium]
MIVLGVNDGHNSSASLIIDGKLTCSIAEERLSREKNHFGFPYKAIKCVLEYSGISSKDIDKIAMSSKHFIPAYYYVSRNSKITIKDYWKEQTDYWYPKLLKNKNPNYLEVLSHRVNKEEFPYDESLIKNESDTEGMWLARVKHLSETLGVDPKIISHHDHHMCHAYYGYITCKLRNEPLLVYTMDGFGDGANGTVSIGEPGQPLKEISRSSNCNIGRMYRYATLLLGMRPAEHEYKLMGLAAYNSHKYGAEAYQVYADTLQVDGLGFKYKNKIKDHFFYFKDKLEGQRFDAIAYGIQKRCEELLTEWISNGINKTGIGNIVMSGGVAQNIKANKIISELDKLNSLFVPPGPGDESISIGAAYLESIKQGTQINKINSASTGYFGPSFSDDLIQKVINKMVPKNYSIQKASYEKTAHLLADGDVVARFGDGRMEFGARALGNRSILADPRKPDVIHHINKLVKMRDFWMPFAPSIIAERENDYINNPKKIDARFMAVGFDSTPLAKEHIPAGLHPFDKTARPQIVHKSDNPSYHSLIKAFEKITGVGALMNTSFNIHGEPIVGTPEDAVDTFLRCGLHHLLIGSWLVSKK